MRRIIDETSRRVCVSRLRTVLRELAGRTVPRFIVLRGLEWEEGIHRRRQYGVRKFALVGVCSNALATGLRLSKRTETHSREHLWSLWLCCCFCSSSRSLLFAPSRARRRRWPLPFYLPVVLLTPRRPITLLETRAEVTLKRLAQFSTATPDDLNPSTTL